jgi:hypothetical protein
MTPTVTITLIAGSQNSNSPKDLDADEVDKKGKDEHDRNEASRIHTIANPELSYQPERSHVKRVQRDSPR